MRQGLLNLAIAVLLQSACTSAAVPDGPAGPTAVWFGDPVEGTSELLLEGPVSFAELLPSWRVVAQAEGQVLEFGPLDATPRSHGTSTGAVSAVAPLPGGAALIAAEEGLFTLQAWGLGPSPLGEVYAPSGEATLLAAPGPDDLDVWIADQAGLSLWRGGELYGINAGDLPTAGARLAWGSPVQGFDAIWLAADEVVYALVEQGDGFVTWEEGGALDALALTVDGVDDLWTVLSGAGDAELGEAGDVRRRLPDGTWQWFRLPEPPAQLVSGPSASVWLRSSGDAPRLWHQALDTWSEVLVDGASPLGPEDRLVGSDPEGRVVVHGPAGLRRVSLGRPTVFLGIEEGDSLADLTEVTLVPTRAADATEMTATLNGAPVELSRQEIGERSVWLLSLDPAELTDGAHELTVTANWEDGHDPVDSSRFFSVGAFVPPTWTEHIEPISEQSCARCHSANGGAHLLDTRARWADEVEDILVNVISGAMPISGDKLHADQVRAIELWRAGGFQE